MAKKKLTVKELEATRKGINKDEEDEKKAKAQGVRTSAPVYTYKDTNVTASDVAKKFNVQLPNKNASTGSNNAPGANAKAPVTSAAYTNKVADMFEKSKLYAAQGPDYVIDLANSIISGAATKPDKGNLGALDIDSIHDMTKITSEVARMLTEAGIFNTREIATNPLYAHLAQQEYRKSLLPTLQGELTTSQKADEANKAAQAEYEAKLRGMNADYSKQAEKAAEWKNFFSLLGENPTLEDKLRAAGIATGQTYDMGVFRGMDKYTAYEKKQALDNWFAGLDVAALSAAPVVEEPEAPKYTSKTAGIEDEIRTLEKYINAYQTLEELTAYARSNPDFATASVYNAPVYEEPSVMERMFVQEMGGAYADDALAAYINGQPMMPQFMRDPRSEDFYKRWEEQGYNYMLDQDREIWNVLRTMDPAKADAYLQALSQIYLLPTRAQGYRSWDETVATNPWTAAPAWAVSVLHGVGNTLDVPKQFAEAWLGVDNPYSAAFDNLNRQGNTRGAQMGAIRESDMPDWLKTASEYAYQGVIGFADNTARLLATGMNPTASLIMAGLQASSHSLHESAGRDDVSSAAKIIKAIGAGAIEVGTEKIGLDALFDMGKTGAKKYLSVVLAELGEESLNAASEPALEAVVAFLFDHEADIKSGPEFWKDLKDTAVTTFISASLSGGGAVASDYLDTRSYGKGIVNNGDVDTIMNVGQSMPENSESKRVYDEITAKQGKGKKPSFYQFGQLTKAIIKDLGEERAAIVNRVQDEAIVERLVELGEDRAAAKQNASIIRRIARGEKVPRQEMFEAKWSDNATQVVKELTRETKPEDVNRAGNKWVADMEAQQLSETSEVKGKQLQVQVATVTPIGKAANRAEEAAKKRVPKQSGKIKKDTDSHVTFRGAAGSAEISGDIMRFEESDEGMQVVVQTGKGKEGEQKVKLEDWISADGDGVATILSYVGDDQLPHSVTAEEANTLMQVFKHSGGNAKAVIQAFDVNYLAGYSGADQVGSVLDPALSKIAYENGKRDAEKDEAQRVEKAKNFRANANPTVTWEGLTGEDGTHVLNEKYESMAEGQRLAVDFGKALSKHTGLNVVYYDGGHDNDSAGYAENGSYDPTTHTIKINVSAGASTVASYKQGLNRGTLGYVAMKVFGHEITHAIEATSTEAYAQYKQAVKEALKAKGQDWATLVRDKIDMYSDIGKKLTYAGAEAEVIADASESMLRNSQFVNNLDADLKGKLQAAIKEFVEKLKQVFKALAGGHREAVALMDELGNYSKELQDLWDAGFAEMAGAGTKTVSPAEVATEPANDTHPAAEQFSITQLADSIGLDVMITGESDTPYAIVDSNGNIVTSVSPDQIEGTQMGKLIEAAVLAETIDDETADAQKKMIADLATLAARYEDQAMVWEIAGSQLYSAIKNNSDKQYSKTVDFGTICSKTQAVVDVLSDTMLKLGRGLTRKEVITAYNKTANNDLSVPCAPCYVFSRWMGVPSLLGRMAEFQSRFGKMTAAELTEYVDGVQRKYAVDGERFSKTIGSMKTRLDNQLETVRGKIQQGRTLGEDVTDLLTLADKLENEFADVEAYNWVTQVLLKSNRVSGAIEVARDAEGQVVIDPAYKPVPNEVLFDMRKTGEFANYPKSWKYRSTRGAGMGKSILPYSGATVGDTVYADQKRRAISKNAFRSLNATKTQRVRAIKTAQKRMKSQNLIGGHRFQSTSDYRPEWGLDYIMTFLEMQAIAAKGQLYTKVIEAVDMFATAGIEVNLSIMANGDGWHLDENGNPVLGVEDFSSVSGIDFTDALQKTKDYDNVQMILVGMNDTHIKLAMADDRITFIIPWHSSGSSESVLKQLFSAVGEDLHTGSDYQDIQSDKPVSNPTSQQKLNAEVRKKILTGQYAKKGKEPTATEMAAIRGNKYLNALYERFYVKGIDDETYGVRLSAQQASQVFPYEYWDTSLTYKDADENGKRFVEYCNDIGLTPRFEKFKGDPGYWKLLIDRRMYNRDGTYHHPKTINVTNVKIGDIASSVSQAKYGDPVKTGNAVQETIEEILANESAPAYVEPSVIDETANYCDQAEVETSIQYSIDDLGETVTTRDYLAESGLEMAETVEERNALTIYQDLLLKHADASDRVIAAERVLSVSDETELPEARKNLAAARAKQRDLYDRLLKVERTAHMQNVVKRSNQFINDLYGKNQADVDKRVAELERKAENLRWDLQGLKGAAKTQQEADIRAAEREIAALQSKATKALLANSENYTKRLEALRKRRDLNIEIDKKARHIKRVVKALNDRIVHEDDYKNVKEPLKPAVHTLVRTFLDGFGNLVFDQKTADKLKSVYDVLAQDDATVEYYDDEVSDWLTTLAKLSRLDEERRAGGVTLESLNDKLYIYTTLADIADHVAHMVTAADTMFMEGRKASVSGVTEDIGNTLLAKEDRRELAGVLGKAANFVDNLIIRGNMMPQFFFEGLNNNGMMQLYDGLQDGVRMYSERLLTGENFLEDAMRRYGYHTWRDMDKVVEFKTQQGHTIHLKRENMMWIYATAKREASNPLMDTHHLDEGGFVYEESSAPTAGLFKAKGHQKHHKIVQEDVEAITAMLTAEQIAFMDECVEFLSTECAGWGNEASMQLFGIKKYKEKYYFPFKVDGGQLYKNSAAGSTSTTSDARVKHISFSHSIKKGANTPLVMGEFTSVIADHINQMATYSGMVVPIENMNRVLNRKVDDDGDMVTIRSLLSRKYGSPSSKYVDDLLKDLNGGPQTDNRGTWDAGIRLFKKNAVVGKMSVAIQQPTAITRAFAYINPRWFVNLHMERPKETWERMMKYSGTTVLKDMGGFNVGLGRGAKNWIERGDLGDYNVFKRSKFLLDQKGFKAAKDEWVDFLTGLPGWMDKVTWISIWNAAENEQAHQHPGMDRNSDEFLQMVGRRFDDIVNHTQVYDSILSKSQNMRSKNTLAKMATSFMAESTLNMNLAYRAFASRDVKQIGKVVSSLLLNAALGAAAYALVGSWNKDDDDRTWEEKYAVAFAGRLADNLNPMASIPYLSDIWNKIQGYDVERTDLSYVLDLAEDGMKFFDKMFNPDEALSYRDYENFVGGMFAAATGIPAKNWMGDARRIWNMTHTKNEDAPSSRVWYGILDEILPGRGTNNTSYYERLLAATMDGDKQEMYDLKDYLMATKGVKESTITTGVRDAYKKVYLRGGIDKTEAVNFLLANNLVTGKTEAERKQNAFEYVDKWEEGTEGYSAYNTLRKAFSDGNSASIQKAWDELEANGWSNDSIGSYVRNTIIKGMVTSGKITTSKATELIRKWYPYKKDKDNVDKPKEWLNSK